MEAYPLYDYIQLTKGDATNTTAEQANAVYQFNIPQGFYYSNQRSSVATIEVISASAITTANTANFKALNIGMVQPTPTNANTLSNSTDAPPILCSFDSLGTDADIQVVYQQQNPAYQISARPSQITIKFFQDSLGSNQDVINTGMTDFIVLLKMTYYDPIKNIQVLQSQFTPTLP
jgi:beta-lactam-binding protein with PASTA domain